MSHPEGTGYEASFGANQRSLKGLWFGGWCVRFRGGTVSNIALEAVWGAPECAAATTVGEFNKKNHVPSRLISAISDDGQSAGCYLDRKRFLALAEEDGLPCLPLHQLRRRGLAATGGHCRTRQQERIISQHFSLLSVSNVPYVAHRVAKIPFIVETPST